jgi:hypothetical protein
MTATTKASSVRIGEKIKEKLRSTYREQSKRVKHPDQRIALAINIIADLDPMDRLGLAGPNDETRLQAIINHMTR